MDRCKGACVVLAVALGAGCSGGAESAPQEANSAAVKDSQVAVLDATSQFPPAATEPTPASPAPDGMMEDCDGLPLADKEACYARQAPDLIAECERMRLHRCAPYARVHELDQELQQLNATFKQAARASYSQYSEDDPAYIEDLEQQFDEADGAWRAFRDAECAFEPLAQGMSRSEAGDLTEACRAERTAARVEEMKERLSTLKEETDHEQRKQ